MCKDVEQMSRWTDGEVTRRPREIIQSIGVSTCRWELDAGSNRESNHHTISPRTCGQPFVAARANSLSHTSYFGVLRRCVLCPTWSPWSFDVFGQLGQSSLDLRCTERLLSIRTVQCHGMTEWSAASATCPGDSGERVLQALDPDDPGPT